jgi:sugar lactone lactonase YvrE
MDTKEEGANGAVYCLSTDFKVATLDTGIVCSNGSCWSPDGKTFYFQDTSGAGSLEAVHRALAEGRIPAAGWSLLYQ